MVHVYRELMDSIHQDINDFDCKELLIKQIVISELTRIIERLKVMDFVGAGDILEKSHLETQTAINDKAWEALMYGTE